MSAPPPWRLQAYRSIESTQDVCRALAEAGEPGHLAVLAERQTHGRGTQGRAWDSPTGNLALSVLLRPTEAARHAGQWALLAAVALADIVATHLPDPGALRLKWPNDLLLRGGKLAGILTESTADAGGGLGWLVIGFGVNLAAAPDVPGRQVACLADEAAPPEPAAFGRALLARLDHWHAIRMVEGFGPVRAAWLERGPDLGSHVMLHLGAQQVGGTFAGLADDGSLLLATGGQVRAFASGRLEPSPCCS